MANLVIHPGEHIQEELDAMSMAPSELSSRLNIPFDEFTGLLKGERDLSAEVALRLSHFFGTSAEFWLNLQNLHDLRLAEQRLGDSIKALPTIKELAAA